MKYYIIFTFALLIGLAYALPQPVGYVNDFANILTDKQLLENELILYEENTTIEIVVVTIDNLPADQNLFTYGVELFQQWGIGKKGEDNGILVLIMKNGTVGNRMRIELGYGIQGYVTGAEAGAILDEAIPFYEEGDYQSTVEIILAGLSDQLVDYVPGKPVQTSATDVLYIILPNLFFLIFVIMIIVSAALSNRCPYCRGKIKCEGDYCVCLKCKKKFKKNRKYAPFIIAGGYHGGGFGGGGFGGGGSGGGGAGR